MAAFNVLIRAEELGVQFENYTIRPAAHLVRDKVDLLSSVI
jgi:hypothetical protein